MAGTPPITCVIPVHDGERFLAAAIDSVLAQDHEVLEVVVIDNGSTDASAAIAEAYGDPVRVVRQENLGPPGGRRRGVEEARGELICLLDADDLYLPGKLSRQVAHLASGRVGASLCLVECFWEPGLGDEEERYRATGRERFTHVFGALLASRSVFDSVGPIRASDWHTDQVDWFQRLAESDVVVEVVPEVLVARRMHPDSLSHSTPTADAFVDFVKSRLDRRRP